MIIRHKEYNCETGEEIITEREETAAEIKSREKRESQIASEIETIEAQRQVILDKLGLTADEAKLLLG
jgi:hypothetical protein